MCLGACSWLASALRFSLMLTLSASIWEFHTDICSGIVAFHTPFSSHSFLLFVLPRYIEHCGRPATPPLQ
jgi:hypothetical protein